MKAETEFALKLITIARLGGLRSQPTDISKPKSTNILLCECYPICWFNVLEQIQVLLNLGHILIEIHVYSIPILRPMVTRRNDFKLHKRQSILAWSILWGGHYGPSSSILEHIYTFQYMLWPFKVDTQNLWRAWNLVCVTRIDQSFIKV